MFLCVPSFILLKLASFCVLLTSLHLGACVKRDAKETVFTNGWAVKIKGGYERAKRIAEKYGFEKVEQVGTLDDFYHLEHPKHPRRSRRSAEDRTQILLEDLEVEWAEQQDEKVREKRGHFHDRMVSRGIIPRFRDPLWDGQWYLDDKRKNLDLDVHVLPVWNRGITGKNVVITILDDGIEHNHTDLIRNYDPAASWDVNDNDPDPFPRYDATNENKHGTRCAGEVAAEANNTLCGVGVAYNSKIGGVRMLDGRVTDRVEAESLSLNPQYIDIYSASWGPSDDGTTVEGPGTLATAAFENGITKGRGGLGSIYVWASGNGGRHDDSCNCDGYTDSIYTLSISSASDHGESPWYSESCSSTLATTFSSGAHGEQRIVTTDLHDGCTERHTGTSASAPLAAGIIALALEVNKHLTWRDIQHIVVHTSNVQPLSHDQDWIVNGVGLKVNMKFGFGLLDADKITKMADPATYKTVPEKSICPGQIKQDARPLQRDTKTRIVIHAEGCSGSKDEVRYLEHVQLLISLSYTRRGDLTIKLTSPMGTTSTLLPSRNEDTSNEGFKKWPFMTTHNWGEDPRGDWILEIQDLGDGRANHGVLTEMQLILHGTKEKPNHLNIPDAKPAEKPNHPDVKPPQSSQQEPQPHEERHPQTAQKVFQLPENKPAQEQQLKAVIPEPVKTPSNAYATYTNQNFQPIHKENYKNIPQQVSHPLPQKIPQPVPHQAVQTVHQQLTQPSQQEVLQSLYQQFSQQQLAQHVPQQVAQQVPQQPQQFHQQLSQQVPVQNDISNSYQSNYAPAEYSSSIKYVESAPSLFNNQYQQQPGYLSNSPRYEVNQVVNNGYYSQTGYAPGTVESTIFSPPPQPPPSPTTKLNFQSSDANENHVPADPSKMNILDFLKILRSRNGKKAPVDRFRQKKEALRTHDKRLS